MKPLAERRSPEPKSPLLKLVIGAALFGRVLTLTPGSKLSDDLEQNLFRFGVALEEPAGGQGAAFHPRLALGRHSAERVDQASGCFVFDRGGEYRRLLQILADLVAVPS